MNKTDVLGYQATDTISGFKGTITGIASYLTGCTQYLIEAKVGEDKDTKSCWFDDSRIDVSMVTIALPSESYGSVLPGGPQPNAPHR